MKQTRNARPAGMYGDVTCLNCGRLLGQALRRDGRPLSIRPVQPGAGIGVTWQAGRGLRCTHCGGRAFVELDEHGFSTPVRSREVARSRVA